MDNKLGEKIKKLRKQLKMTQSQLAEPEMTKSMLSQIENGLAMPSMKNLHVIANKLNKPISYFLDDEETYSEESGKENNYDNNYEHIVEKLKKIDGLIKSNNYEEALSLLDELEAANILKRKDKLMADMLYQKGLCMMNMEKYDEGQSLFSSAYKIYMSNNNYIEAAKSYIEIAIKPWRSFNYDECIRIYLKAKEIYEMSSGRDTHFEIELLSGVALFYSAKGDFDDSLSYLNKALEISDSTGVYYKADEIHRLRAGLYMLQGDYENYEVNIEKSLQFAIFVDNKKTIQSIYALKAVYETEIGNYEEALKHIEKINVNEISKEKYVYYMIKGKALYHLGKYSEALENLKLVDYPDYINHKFDYLMMWSSKVYEGLIYEKLNKIDKAIESINTSVDKMRKFGNSKLLAFALESLSEIYYIKNDYEKAYKLLKEAKEVKEYIIKNKIYF